MKKWLFALMLLPMVAVAIENSERTWVTAQDLDTQTNKRLISKESVKQYLLRLNTWEMCTYPELWKATETQRNALLEKSSLATDPEGRWLFWSHNKGNNELLEEFFGDEPQFEEFFTGGSTSENLFATINSLSKKEQKATLVKNCKDWGKE